MHSREALGNVSRASTTPRHRAARGRRWWWSLLAIVPASAHLTGCKSRDATADEGPLPRASLLRSAVGCYAFQSSASLAPTEAMWVSRFGYLRLDSTAIGRPRDRLRRATFPELPDSTRLDFQGWQADSLTDTVRILLGDAFAGAVVSAFAVGDTLTGYAEYSASSGNTPIGPVRGRRLPCDRG